MALLLVLLALVGPTVTLDPTTVPVSGQLITVQISGCPPGVPITITSGGAPVPGGAINADGAGNATTSVASGGSPGTFTVSAACGGATANAQFTVVRRAAAASPAPATSGPAGKLIGIGAAAVLVVVLATVVLLVRRRRALVGMLI